MPSVNKVILVGHLGNEPELKQTSSGHTVCKFRMATSRRWKDKEGQQQEDTCWHHIVSWGRSAEFCAAYLRKGKQVYVEGRISTRSYLDPQGAKRFWTEVVSTSVLALGPRDADRYNTTSSAPSPSEYAGSAVLERGPYPEAPTTTPQQRPALAAPEEDDLPF